MAGSRSTPAAGGNDLAIAELLRSYLRFAEPCYVKDRVETGAMPGVRVAIRFFRKGQKNTSVSDFGPLALKAPQQQQQMVKADHCRRYLDDSCDRIRRIFNWRSPTNHRTLIRVFV